MPSKLNAGDSFPTLTIEMHGGQEQQLPLPIDSGYQVLLFYRGAF